MNAALDALSFPLWGSRLIEASAGTGKTYTIASLYLRLVLGHGELPEGRPLTPPDILVVTFTRAATQELRDRIRRRLTEAASCFLEEAEGDQFLRRLRGEYPTDRWASCARQLQIAAQWMDDAAVSTIDAWCYRMLREHAFDSGGLFDVDMEADDIERVAEATRDYWRSFIAPLESDDVARVLQLLGKHRARTATNSAVDCDSLASILRRWLPHVEHYAEAPEPAKVFSGLREENDLLKAQWREWAPEMRTILQDAYDKGLYDRRALRINHWTGWCDKLEQWASDPSARLPFAADAAIWSRLSSDGLAEIWKEGNRPPEHVGFAAIANLYRDLEGLDAKATRLFPHAAMWVSRRMAELQHQRATLDFGGLLQQLDAALAAPNGDKLASTIRAQFPAALIDEFQDTDPVQYRIFNRIYRVATNAPTTLLALIGDPKQAIYRFRGADIHAYLAARRACAGRLYTLESNFRSSAAMVAAVNQLFDFAERNRERGAFLFRHPVQPSGEVVNMIPFHPVNAAADPGEWEVQGEIGAALTIWHDAHTQKPEAAAESVAQGCATEIGRLLQLGTDGRAGFRKADAYTPLRPGHIAVLVNSGREAERLRAALGLRGIRSVYLSDDSSVYRSAAAPDVLAWLRACAHPESGSYVRAALATAGIGLSWDRLDAFVQDESQWETMLERFAAYKELWQRRGVLPMLRRLMHEFGVPARLLTGQHSGIEGGERQLTDLLHLAELLQAASVRLDGEHALIRFLEEHIEEGGGGGIDNDVSRMRLESDAGLVQIVTVHKAKGLEYPLVFYPYAYHSRVAKSLEIPAVYRDADDSLQVLANLADADETLHDRIRSSMERERLAEDLRKLYVALTRARHATWIALAPVEGLGASATGYLLGGTDACRPEALENSLKELAGNSPDIEIAPLPPATTDRYQPMIAGESATSWRTMRRRIVQRWALSSYSALARMALEQSEGLVLADTSAADIGPALPDDARLEAFQEAYVAEAQFVESEDEDIGIPSMSRLEDDVIHRFPRGAEAGSFLHGLLEWVFRQGPEQVLSDPAALNALVSRRCRARGWEAYADELSAWLGRFFSQPFHINLPGCGPQPDLVLADVASALAEMEFWFGVRDADLPALEALVMAESFQGRTRPAIARGRLNGMLRGFIDLVFEHHGRYYVADYKSNWLGASSEAYSADAISQAILAHRYDLQSAIYLFALHRLLQARLGERYDYDEHVGGAMIFFVRGSEASGQALHIERPSNDVMKRLEAVFDGLDAKGRHD